MQKGKPHIIVGGLPTPHVNYWNILGWIIFKLGVSLYNLMDPYNLSIRDCSIMHLHIHLD
jgi:hypothetical protein